VGNGKRQATTLAELWSSVWSLTSSCSICGGKKKVKQYLSDLRLDALSETHTYRYQIYIILPFEEPQR